MPRILYMGNTQHSVIKISAIYGANVMYANLFTEIMQLGRS